MATERLAADTLIHNAVVRTLDASGTIASAVALKGERIVGVGSADELRPLLDKRTEIIDAGGKTVLPGLIDAHTHFHIGVLSSHMHIDWQGFRMPRTIAQALEDVRRRASEVPPGQWIRGDGISQTRIAERRLPNRHELDAVAPDHPVVLIGGAHFSIAANSRALAIAGISRATPDPPGGHIERDADGEPTGVLLETAKLRLDPAHPDTVLPAYSAAERLDAMRKTVQSLLAEGITSIHDIVSEPEEVAGFIRLRRAGELGLRVQLLVRGIETRTPLEHLVGLGLEHGLGDDWLRLGGVKMSIDGACAYRAAAVYDAYPGQPENFGLVRIPQDELEAGIAVCHRNGIRLAVHAVGPRAVDMALDAFEKAAGGSPRPDLRHRLEHVHLPPRPGQLERARDLGLLVCVQPTFVWKHGDAWRDIWGKDALADVMPLRRMLDLGLPIFAGTDYPGTPISPFLGLRSALARRTRDGDVVGPGQAISLDEALRLWTTAAAYGGFDEHKKGSLEVGKLADLIVVSQDPYAVAPEELDQLQVDLTMVGGRVAFTRA